MNRTRQLYTGLRAGVVAFALGGLVACGSGPREQVGAVLGGTAGGVAGAQIGQGTGQLAATGVGAGLGTLAGAAAGRSLDATAARDRTRSAVRARAVPTHTGVRRSARLVADPTHQVPIPGAEMPGGFWSWLPDLDPPAPMRNVEQASAPGESAACEPLDGPRLKPAFRCTRDGVSYVVQ